MTSYPPPPPLPPPGQPAAYGAPGLPPGMYFDPVSKLALPNGTELAGHGRRIGAYFLSALLAMVTLGIGYVIWGLVAWGKGTSPAFQCLGVKVYRPQEQRVATWGQMFLRDVVGGIVQSIWIVNIVSFILFLSDDQRRTIADRIGSTVVLHDPNKVLG